MPIKLRHRDPAAHEIMDDPDCDPQTLHNTYRQFRYVNVIARSKWIYQRWVRPAMKDNPAQTHSLLDIGFGGGDIVFQMARWAEQDSLKLNATGIELDSRALDYVRTFQWPRNVSFRVADVHDLAASGERFDFVISNHMLHHLDQRQFGEMLESAATVSKRFVLFIDLRRSDVAYLLFAAGTRPFFRKSYIRHDGLASLRRSYTFDELKQIAPPGWKVQRLFPFRLILSHRK